MSRTSDYQRVERLYESTHSLIYRARRNTDGQSVILKHLKEAYPSPEQIGWFEREYRITKSLDVSGVVQVYDLQQLYGIWTMVVEDFGARSLAMHEWPRRLPLTKFFALAIEITRIVEQIHERRVIHKDINPSNIVLNADTGVLKFIDFGIAMLLPQEKPTFAPVTALAGTLAYIPPEQTGRMNRGLDYRADFYALGVTFYEFLTGTLPFSAEDELALIHAHIAKTPTPPHKQRPEIPLVLSDVVMKLMAKNAEDRYQSAHGLLADLEAIANDWRTHGRSRWFALGQHDTSAHFRIVHKLYGRDDEIAQLLAAFHRVSEGGRQLLLIAGGPGIGKSTLVQEIHKPITSRHGYFSAGKFDQLQRNSPYDAVIAAFRELLRQLLRESEDNVARWRRRLLAALGGNARVITDVVPEIELIIGPQPPVPVLPPAEAENRFNMMFQRFIAVFTRAEHPLVLFLDDLQWADDASLRLVKRLITAVDTQYLLIIGAYRPEEVSAGIHPLTRLQEALLAAENNPETIALAPLGLAEVTRLLADTLHTNADSTVPLADVVLAKTGGNPFFVTEMIKSLHKEGLLFFDPEHRRWAWHLEQIRQHDATGNVVDLMTGRIRHLAPRAQRIVQLAACIGNRFDLQLLATIADQSPGATADDLWEALEGGLILPLGDNYKLIGKTGSKHAEALDVTYRFAHDRVQEAAYSLIPEHRRPVLHNRIGRLWRDSRSRDERDAQLFEIVNQCNLGREFTTDRAERLELAGLNLRAGQRAKASAAYRVAFRYLKTGVEWASEDVWQWDYELALTLYIDAAEAAYLSGNFAWARRHVDLVIARALSLLDKVRAYEVSIQLLIAENNPSAACDVALSVLDLLGIGFPENYNDDNELRRQHERLQGILANRLGTASSDPSSGSDSGTSSDPSGDPIAELVEMPAASDPLAVAAMRIMAAVVTPISYAKPKLLQLVVFQMIELFVSKGKTPLSAFGCVYYGAWLCGGLGDVETGYRFGKLALALMERDRRDELLAKVYGNYTFFVRHWKEHAGRELPRLLEAYQRGLETGDLEFAGYCLYSYCWHQHATGKPIAGLIAEVSMYSPVIRDQLGQEMTCYRNEMLHQILVNLQREDGDAERACHISGAFYDEDAMVPAHIAANHQTIVASFHYNKLLLYYMFGKYEDGLASADEFLQRIDCMIGGLEIPIFYFHDCLNRLAICLAAVRAGRVPDPAHLQRIEATRSKLANWAKHADDNHRHRLYLVEAEYAGLNNRDLEARDYYDKAAALANEQTYFNEEAIAYQRAAEFYFAQGHNRLAAHYVREAHYAYERWGARAKMKHLEVLYPELFRLRFDAQKKSQTVQFSTRNRDYRPENLDVLSIIKASQAISSELALDRLMARLIELVMQNAGAQRGVLVLLRTGHLVVEATHSIDDQRPCVLQSIPIEHCGGDMGFAVEIVQYVARTREQVVLADAVRDGRFGFISHIQRHEVRSVLCVPLSNHGTLIGIVYLENNSADNVFTQERVNMVSLLGTQASISIENARAVAAQAEQERLRLAQERLKMENELLEQQSRELSKLNADKDRFFAIISHDLRSPFHSMLSQIGVLRQASRKFDDADLTRRIELAHNAAKVTLELLENLLSWSRLQRRQMLCEPTKIDLEQLSSGVVALFRQRAEHKGIDLYHTLDPGIRIRGDKNMIETVLRNLLSNALKFTPTGGRVTIAAHPAPPPPGRVTSASDPAHPTELDHEPLLEVAVRDSGVGMQPEELDKLFRIDVHYTTLGTHGERGTGLGLILCREMIRQHGGDIRIASKSGQGTEVIFTVPVITLPSVGPAPAHCPPSAPATSTASGLMTEVKAPVQPSAMLVAPDSEQIEILWQLAMRGDISGIKKYVTALEAVTPSLGPFVHTVQNLASNYEIELILALIEQYR